MKVFSALLLLATLSGAAATATTMKSPVEKVVKLLEELSTQLKTDLKVDQQIFDKFACWCENTGGKKAADLVQLEQAIFELKQEVLELKGTVAVLAKEISDLSTRIADNEASQKSATAVRSKENEEWQKEKAEYEEAIDALERAIKVLSGAGTKTGLLQDSLATSAFMRMQAKTSIRSVVRALPSHSSLMPKQLAAIDSFVQMLEEPSDVPEGVTAATADASYSPASATVQGILKDMYDTFTADIEKLTQEEATKQRDFEDLIATLTEELNLMNAEVLKKEEEKAAKEQELAQVAQELDDTQKELDETIAFFEKLKADCLAKHEEWTARKEGYTMELEGIKKALEILTSDEARALFNKAIKPGMETSFMQLNMDSSMKGASLKAYEALKASAKKSHSLRLASLAATVRTMGVGHFDKVIEEIDKMIEELKAEEKEDIKQRDWCKDEYQENSEEKAEVKWLIKNNEAMIVKLTGVIEKLVEEIEETVKTIDETKKQIEEMEIARKAEHDEFKIAKKDDEDAIALLEKAKKVLGEYYEKEGIDMGPIEGSSKLLQEPEFAISKDQAPDATFKAKGHRKNQSKGIISILTMIIEDLEAEIKNGIKEEVAAQTEFEKNVDAAKKLIESLEEKKTNLEEDKAETEQKRDDEEETKKSNEEKLALNEEYLKSIKPDCDWMLNSFDERVAKRKAEMNGLVTAKEYLAGAAPPTMMQDSITFDKAKFDDTKLQDINFVNLRR